MTLFTANGARLMGQRGEVGGIEAGMRHDLVVVEKSPFEVPVTEIHETRVRMIFIDGENVYDAAGG